MYESTTTYPIIEGLLIKKANNPHPQKGIALVLVIFVMIILLLISVTLSSIANTDNQIAIKHFYSKKAFNIARSGLTRAAVSLRSDPYWGSTPITHDYGDNGKYTVSVERFDTSGKTFWKVTSIGEVGEYKRTLVAWMELEPFSRYLWLTDSEQGKSGMAIWYTGRDRLNGPTHTNTYFYIYQTPQFSDKVTSSNRGDPYYDPDSRTYTQGGHTYTDPSKFYHYYYNYSHDYPKALDDSPDFSFTGGIQEAEFPANLEEIKARANYKINSDVIYIKFLPSGKMEVKPKGQPPMIIPTTETTLFVDGEIKKIYGTVSGKVTVASSEDINITKNILYNDKDVDMLGLVAQNDIIIKTPPGKKEDITIQASLMTVEGSMTVFKYDQGVDRGTLHIYGSVVQKYRGPIGTFTSWGRYTGYSSKDYQYDPRLKFTRPPNYPTTGKVIIKTMRDKGALGGS